MTAIYKLRYVKTDVLHPHLNFSKIISRSMSLEKIVEKKTECEYADAKLGPFLFPVSQINGYEILVCDDERKSMPSNRRLQ